MIAENLKHNKSIFIYISKTGLSVKQLLNKDLLEKIIVNRKIIILSHFIIPKSIKSKLNKGIIFHKLDETIEIKQTQRKTYKLINFFRQFIYNRKNLNTTIEDFNEIFLNEKRKNFKFFLFEYIFLFAWRISRFLFGKFNLLRFFLNFIDHKFHTIYQIENLIKKYKPQLLLTSSPGFLNYDFSIINSCKKNRIKTVSLLLSWDHASGLGLIRTKTDNYLVWGENSKNDLIKFHDIEKYRILISGPIHWDFHYDKKLLLEKEFFLKQNDLNINYKTILVSLKSPTRTKINEIISFLNFLKNLTLTYDCQYIIKPHPINYSNKFINELEKIKIFCENSQNFIISKNFINKSEKTKSKNLISDKNGYIEDVFEIDETEKKYVYNLLEHSDLMINFFSTLNIEAAIHNLPSINYVFEEHKKTSKIGENRKNLYLDYSQTHNYRLVNTGGSDVCFNRNDLVILINKFLQNKNLKKKERYQMVIKEINLNNYIPTDNFIKILNNL